jgi:TonB-dependent receptor
MSRSVCGVLLLILVSAFVWLSPLKAQVASGTIAGTVKDPGGLALTGSTAEVQPLGKRTVSDNQGQFRLTDLPPGEYSLTLSYVGLRPFNTTVEVRAGQVSGVDAVLQVPSASEEVIVTAEMAQGEAEAINIERTADNIVQVLPSQVINSLPNTNVADAVGRLPSVTLERDEGEGKYVQIRGTEPRLSNLTIDGVNVPSPESNVRNIKMDIIPADLVDRIEVNKTLSANQDGDAIGGSVNLVTREATDRPFYSFSGEGGYTPIANGRWLDAFAGTVGRRFGESKRLGVMFGGSYDWNARGIDDLEPSQSTATLPSGKAIAVVNGEDTREYLYYRTRYGFATNLSYKLGAASSVYLRGLFSDFHDFGSTFVYTYAPGVPLTQAGGLTMFDSTGKMQYREYIRRPDQQIFSVSTGARHELHSTVIAYEFAVSRAHVIGGFPTTYFSGPTNVQMNLDTSNPYRPKFSVVNGVNIFDPTAYTISQAVPVKLDTTQLNLQGGGLVSRAYTWGSHLGIFEAGFKVRNAHKTNDVVNYYYDNNNPNLTLAQGLGTFTNPNYYDKSYQLGPLSDYSKLLNLFVNNPGSFTFDFATTHITSDSQDFDATERVYAGYLMNTLTFGKVTLQTGLRFEQTDSTYNANQVNLNGGAYVSTTPVPGSGDYLNVLPSVQFQYLLTPNTNIRASFGIGIARPNWSDLVPSIVADPNQSPKSVVVGNPALKATRGNNYDLIVEHYFHPLGILQAGFFYKQLSDPIYNTTQTVSSGVYSGYQLQQSINGPNAHITGVEAAWEQRLSFLPGFLSGFGVAANYSYTTSQVSFPAGFAGGRTDRPALLRQAPNTWNLGFTYDRSRFSMRFGVSHNDANIYAYNYQQQSGVSPSDPILGLKGPTGDIYLYAHTQFDVQGSYRIAKGFQAVVSGLNLSNEVFGFYQGSPIYPIQREFYHPTVSFGMRWSSSVE